MSHLPGMEVAVPEYDELYTRVIDGVETDITWYVMNNSVMQRRYDPIISGRVLDTIRCPRHPENSWRVGDLLRINNRPASGWPARLSDAMQGRDDEYERDRTASCFCDLVSMLHPAGRIDLTSAKAVKKKRCRCRGCGF